MPKIAFLKNPVAALLPAVPGWHALVIETDADGKPVWFDDAKTRVSVQFKPITEWGIALPESATKPPSAGAVLGAIFAPVFGLHPEGISLVPIATNVRVQDEPGFRLLCPPGETLEQAIARAEAAGPAPNRRPS
jgi:hypothetical protein